MAERICPNCGSIAHPVREVPGNLALEVTIWLLYLLIVAVTWLALPLLLIPLAYTFYRSSSRRQTCRSCGTPDPVPLDSPRGQALAAAFAGAQEVAVMSAPRPARSVSQAERRTAQFRHRKLAGG